MSGEPKPSQDGHQPLQTLTKFLPSKQPVVGSNPTGGVFQISNRAMDRFRDELGKIPETAPLDSPVVISLSDALTLARVLLQKFR